ncbi:hypothetical protein WK04_26270 [Burkholderia ubonensis]|nr:hypothetical protein WK04_26270 [Burkholderia ubonensis]
MARIRRLRRRWNLCGLRLLSEQHRQCVTGRLECGLLTLTILLLLLELGELYLRILTPQCVFLRLLLILEEVREPCESGHVSPQDVKPHEFPPPE